MAAGDNRGVRIQDHETIDIKNKSGRTMMQITLQPGLRRGYYRIFFKGDAKCQIYQGKPPTT